MPWRRWSPVFAVLLLGLYARIIVTEALVGVVDHDEGMYTAAARCVADGQTLYRDVVFTQTPASAYLYAGLFRWTGYSLLKMRLLNGMFDVAVAAVLYVMLARHAPGPMLVRRWSALTAVALLAFSDLFLFYNVIARNYAPSLFFMLSALFLALESGRTSVRRRLVLTAAAGAMLGVAVQFKLTMLVAAAPLSLFVWLRCPVTAGRSGGILAAAVLNAAMLASLTPTLVLLVREPSAVFFSTYRIHLLIAEWRTQVGHAGAGLADKLAIWSASLLRDAWPIAAAAAAACVALCVAGRRRRGVARLELPLLALGTALALAAAYFWMTPTWPDYVTQVLPLLILLGAGGLPLLASRRRIGAAFAAIVAIAVATGPTSVHRLLGRREDQPTPYEQFVETSRWMHEQIHRDDAVLCVYPAYSMAAGLPPTPGLAGGMTAVNVGDRLTPRQRRDWNVIAQDDILASLRDGRYEWFVAGLTCPWSAIDLVRTLPNWREVARPGGVSIFHREPRPAADAAVTALTDAPAP